MAIRLRRKRSLTGIELYQVWPDDHPTNLPDPPWRQSSEFCSAIRGALFTAFVLLSLGDEMECTQEEWNGYFKTAKECAASSPNDYSDWGSY